MSYSDSTTAAFAAITGLKLVSDLGTGDPKQSAVGKAIAWAQNKPGAAKPTTSPTTNHTWMAVIIAYLILLAASENDDIGELAATISWGIALGYFFKNGTEVITALNNIIAGGIKL